MCALIKVQSVPFENIYSFEIIKIHIKSHFSQIDNEYTVGVVIVSRVNGGVICSSIAC